MAKVKLLDPQDARRRLDRYELIGEIAAGGMATVFLARLAGVGGFQRFVAIKRLHPHLAEEEEFVEMFLDEARLAAGIHHPHVVPILEVGTSDSGFYLVMEYIEGDTLARIVARGLSNGPGVPRPILLRICLDALAGLHAAHELTDGSDKLVDLVHRDCSPQNILVGVDGCSRITDFGVARATARISTTRHDRLKGKIAYMAPEQAKGLPDIDRRADIFAMGIVIWEVLASKRLFKSENEAATLARVMLDPIPRLRAIAPSVPLSFDQVCGKALERDPDKRYQSAAEFADALERAARTAALHSPGELGVASPREVAAYVQSVLGQDIAAQRESVRAWLSQTSEPSIGDATEKKLAHDRTIKLALAAADDAPHIEVAGSLTLVDLLPESEPPDTLIGIGDSTPARSSASSALGPPSVAIPLTSAPREPLVSPPSSGRTMVGVGPAQGPVASPMVTNARQAVQRYVPPTLIGPASMGSVALEARPPTAADEGGIGRDASSRAQTPPILLSTPRPPVNGLATHDLDADADADDEGETRIMRRDKEVDRPSFAANETTPVSKGPDAVRSGSRKSSTLPYFIVFACVAIAATAFVVHARFVVNDAASPVVTAKAVETPATKKEPQAPKPEDTASATAAPPEAAADAPTASSTPEATAAHMAPHEPVRSYSPRGSRPRPTPPPASTAVDAPKPAPESPPPPPPPDGDLANPYR